MSTPSVSDRILGSVLLFVSAGFAWFLTTWGLLGGSGDASGPMSAVSSVGRWVTIVWPVLAALSGAVVFLRRWARGATVGWVPLVFAGLGLAGWLVGVLIVMVGG